ncbi:MAG: lipase family protein, partial [Polyangiales bacterium]
PVYPQLVEELRAAAATPTRPHPTARHTCAVLSSWAYADLDTLSQMAARLGLFKSRCLRLDVSNNGMLVRSTAYLIQSEARDVTFLIYRGTDPFDFSTWAVSADVNPAMVPVRDNGERRRGARLPIVRESARNTDEDAARVHGGFYRNQRATWFRAAEALRQAVAGKSILDVDWVPGDVRRDEQSKPAAQDPLVFVTGHSLGGAMALIAAYKLASDPAYFALSERVAQIYTFGQPMVGNAGFGAAWRGTPLHDRLFCHLYGNDIVPYLPPADTRTFVHVGQHYRSEPRRDQEPSTPEMQWSEQPSEPPAQARSLGELLLSFLEFLGVQVPVVGRWLSGAYAVGAALEDGLDKVHDVARRLPLIGQLIPELTPHVRYSIYDHMPTQYVACSQRDGVLTEFGDDF